MQELVLYDSQIIVKVKIKDEAEIWRWKAGGWSLFLTRAIPAIQDYENYPYL